MDKKNKDMKHPINEIWKDIPGYEGMYECSNYGNIKSVDRNIENSLIGSFIKKGIHKSPSMRGNYLKVALSKNGVVKQISVHRIIAETFITNFNGKKCVNHKNGIKTDNRVENLEWNSYSENTNHSYKNGLQVSQKGSSHGKSKTNENDVLEMRNMYRNDSLSVSAIAKMYNLSVPTVSEIVNNKSWVHVKG